MNYNYQKKPRLVQAIQFHTNAPPLPEYIKLFNERYYVTNQDGNLQEIKDNDWAILDRDKIHYYSCSNEIFRAMYDAYSG